MKKYFVIATTIILVIILCCVPYVLAETKASRAICTGCGAGMVTQYCGVPTVVVEEETHVSKGITCHATLYSRGTWERCDNCTYNRKLGNHYCLEQHSTCSKGTLNWCTIGSTITPP